MTYLDDMTAAAKDMYSLFGVSCDYAGRDTDKTVTAIIEHDIAQYGDVIDISGMVATISVRVSEMAYPPRRGDTYTIAGKTYVVDSPVRADEIEHVMLVA